VGEGNGVGVRCIGPALARYVGGLAPDLFKGGPCPRVLQPSLVASPAVLAATVVRRRRGGGGGSQMRGVRG
jgi:hypothetical protein